MLPISIDLFYAFASVLLGAAGASWLWYSYVRGQAAVASQRKSPLAADFAVRLNELVSQVALDVGEHNSQVEEINEELTSSKSHDSTEVLDVVVKLVEANQHIQKKLASTEQKLHEQTDRMQTLLAESRTDALTLLANRRAFDDELVKRFAEFRRQGRIFSLTVVDVDHFKSFNDTCGHRAGDEVLRNVARVLRRKMRETDMVARYGGDEFAIIHPGTGLADACKSALRACEAVGNSHFVHDGQSLQVTVSLGVAELLSNENASETLKRADAAMYASKEAGNNCIHFHDGKVICRVVTSQQPLASPVDVQPQSQPVPGKCKEDEKAGTAPDAECSARSDEVAEPEMLLNLLGRTCFCQQVRNRMAEWNRSGPIFSVALIAVSQCGECGRNSDQRARELASQVTARFLVATIREMDVLCSYTPGCFALMMPGAGLDDAIRVAARILGELSESISSARGAQPTFTLSAGVVQAIESDDATSILQRAEMALDAADRGGGNRVYCHDGQRVAPGNAISRMETMACLG
ncbi:MAG: GGDEF domain-containing protein [Thermoguttaceae bacterium]